MKNLFLDTDVILDYYFNREPHYTEILALFDWAIENDIQLYASALIYANLYYILAKNKGKAEAKSNLISLTSVVKILPVSANSISLALNSSMPDFEDAIQFFNAVESRMECIITRNKKDYKQSYLPVLDAGQFLELMGQNRK